MKNTPIPPRKMPNSAMTVTRASSLEVRPSHPSHPRRQREGPRSDGPMVTNGECRQPVSVAVE